MRAYLMLCVILGSAFVIVKADEHYDAARYACAGEEGDQGVFTAEEIRAKIASYYDCRLYTSDIKWFFEGWDNVKAEMAGFELNYMPLNEYDERLDYYTPVLIASEDVIENDPELVRSFLRAVKKGYQFAIDNPDESAEILSEYVPDYDIEFLKKSQAFLSANYTDDKENWGVMEDAVWDNYTDFMVEYGLILSLIHI